MAKPNPEDDGVEFINIYYSGTTVLGKLLSNLSRSFFTHPVYGDFASMEAFYYWLSTGKTQDQLRGLSGHVAKREGQRLSRVTMNRDLFEATLISGLYCKLEYYPLLQRLVLENDLPFKHFYVYGSINPNVVEPKGSEWLINGWYEVIDHYRETGKLGIPEGYLEEHSIL